MFSPSTFRGITEQRGKNAANFSKQFLLCSEEAHAKRKTGDAGGNHSYMAGPLLRSGMEDVLRLIWDKRDVVLGGNRVFETYDVRGKLTVYDKDEQKDIRRKRLAKGEKRLAEAHASCLEEALLPPAAKKAKK